MHVTGSAGGLDAQVDGVEVAAVLREQQRSARAAAQRAGVGADRCVEAGVKAGGLVLNHNQTRMAIKSGVKAGGLKANHNQTQRKSR